MMKNTVQASLEDTAAILELQKLAYQSEARLYHDFSIPPLLQTLEALQDDFAHAVFLKVEDGETVIGSVKGHQVRGTCYVERLIVHPDYQGQGVGTALMEQLESCFGQAERFELFTGHKSERNIRLYERLGYKRFKGKNINKNLSFVFMEKHR